MPAARAGRAVQAPGSDDDDEAGGSGACGSGNGGARPARHAPVPVRHKRKRLVVQLASCRHLVMTLLCLGCAAHVGVHFVHSLTVTIEHDGQRQPDGARYVGSLCLHTSGFYAYHQTSRDPFFVVQTNLLATVVCLFYFRRASNALFLRFSKSPLLRGLTI